MKIRNGFVSNSSSSSFVFFGIRLKCEDIKKKFSLVTERKENGCEHNFDRNANLYCSECGAFAYRKWDDLNTIGETIRNIFPDLEMNYDRYYMDLGIAIEDLNKIEIEKLPTVLKETSEKINSVFGQKAKFFHYATSN